MLQGESACGPPAAAGWRPGHTGPSGARARNLSGRRSRPVAAGKECPDEWKTDAVGTRKGAFVLTSDGTRKECDINGPHVAGWGISHVAGSPADPNRLYASETGGWFGQLVGGSDDGGLTWVLRATKFGS